MEFKRLFPLEAKFKDLKFVEEVYRDVVRTALKHGTTAGGTALNLPIGKLEKGYSFDVQILSTENIPQFYKEKTPEDLLHKILLLSESSDIKEVWVQGRRVASS